MALAILRPAHGCVSNVGEDITPPQGILYRMIRCPHLPCPTANRRGGPRRGGHRHRRAYFFRIATFPAIEPPALTLNGSVQCFAGTPARGFRARRLTPSMRHIADQQISRVSLKSRSKKLQAQASPS